MPSREAAVETAHATAPADVTRAGSTRPELRPVAIWAGTIVAGLVLLYLRYDWDLGDGHYAERAFLLSAYLFALVLPTSFYLLRRVLLDTRAAALVTGVIFVVLALPWKALGLDGLAYYADRPRWFEPGANGVAPAHQWLFDGTLRSFPHDWLFLLAVFALGAGLIWGVTWLRRRAGAAVPSSLLWLLLAAFAVICLQTYLHTSMRNPYAYYNQFLQGTTDQPWFYVISHFRDGSGVSNADQFVFSSLEEYFQGAAADGNNMLIRRPLSFYGVAQVSYFINTYYVWIAANCLVWLAAVVATGRWVGRVAGPRAGLFAAALVTVGPGFIGFVGTTAMYMQAYAAVIIALCLFEDLMVRSGARRRADIALFTAALTLCMLVYDLLPLTAALLVYGLVRRVRLAPLIGSLVVALVISRAFPLLLTTVLDTEIVDTNTKQLSAGIDATRGLLTHPSITKWYEWTTNLVPRYGAQLLQAFFVIPVLLAAAGLAFLKDRALQALTAMLVLTGFAVVAVLQIGEQWVGEVPRLVYPVFPAIYLLAAIALARLEPRGRLRSAAPWIVIGVMAVLVNFDVFGYPALYVEHFSGHPAAALPR